jgi:hypothetical protein
MSEVPTSEELVPANSFVRDHTVRFLGRRLEPAELYTPISRAAVDGTRALIKTNTTTS